MLRALLYLRFTSFKNWGLTRLRSLRHPKQLVGIVVFAGYFWFFFLRHIGGGPAPSPSAVAMHSADPLGAAQLLGPVEWLPLATAIGAVLLLVFVTFMWIVPTQRASLGFTEAEIAFLFPAPVTRRSLVHFRLLSGQLRSLVGATIMMLISNRWNFLGGNPVTHALGWWFIFSGLNLHFSGATFTLTRLGDSGVGTARRRLWVAALLLIVVGLTFWRLPAVARVPTIDAAALRSFADWALMLTNTAPLSWLLWPFKLVIGPFVAPDARAFFLALGPALLVVGAHYFWVVQTAIDFEEASIDHAQKRSARVAAWRSGQRRFGDTPTKAQRPPFRLAGVGRPELAFLWKNLLSTWPYFNLRTFGWCALAIVAGAGWFAARPGWEVPLAGIGGVAGFFGLYLLVIGPQFARQDLRSDLAHADILKTYPIAGWQLVLGELLAPIAILTGIVWLTLLTFVLAFSARLGALPGFTVEFRVVASIWAALIVPVLITLQLMVPNAAALFFPSWFQVTRGRGGPEVAGQRMLFFFAQIVTMAVTLLPAAAFGAAVFVIVERFFGNVVAASAAAPVLLVILLAEIACGLWLLGRRFEQFDLSAEIRS